MDLQRLFLYIALALLLFLVWDAWQRDYNPARQAQPTAAQQPETPAATGPTPPTDVPSGIPSPAVPAGATGTPSTSAAPARQQATVSVHTDTLQVSISLDGGDIVEADLLKYPVSLEARDQPFRLLQEGPQGVYVAQSGLLGPDAPDHHALYSSPSTSYELAPGEDQLTVALHWDGPNGLKVTKLFTFQRGDYLIKVQFKIENGSTAPWAGRMYAQLQRTQSLGETQSRFGTYTYTGAAISGPEKLYEKVNFDEMAKQNLSRDVAGGWVAMIQHYFVSAWVPPQTQTNHYYTNVLKDSGHYIIGTVTQPIEVAPGQSGELAAGLFAGPKLQNRLEQIAKGLDLTVDYGWLWFIAQPIFWLLKAIHGLVGNWGWAIVLVTVVVKAAFYHLSATSYRSMANMRRVQPRLTAIRERYAGDKQRLNQAMMDLYKTEKINPLGGCLPIAVQIPVFIALYWVLLESVELRQAPFILWIVDLSTKDPYFVLPLLMGITMFIQQKLNPAPPDPIQAKVMMTLPFIFTVFFAFFPAGLVLYWLVNNTLSIAQQWNITRNIERSVKPASN